MEINISLPQRGVVKLKSIYDSEDVHMGAQRALERTRASISHFPWSYMESLKCQEMRVHLILGNPNI